MPICPFCQRDDLPIAAAFPPKARIAVAHVKPNGEPCMDGSPTGTYDTEVLALIVQDDALWDPELRGEPVDLRTGRPFAENIPPLDEPPVTAPPPVGATIVRENAKGDFVIEGLVGVPPVQITSSTPLPTMPPITGREPQKPDRRADTRRRDDKRKKALAARKPKPATDGNEEDGIDDWDP